MKKFISKIAHMWVLCALLLAFVWAFTHLFTLDFKIQMMVVAFVLAPLSEELLYRWLPVQLEKNFPKLGWIPGVLANFLFIAIHENNYPYAGIYWAFAVQGMLGFCCLYVMRRYGYWSAVFFHSKYNIGIFLIQNYT